MGLLARIKSWIRKEQFDPTWLGPIVNPVYITRSGLNKNIKELALRIRGSILDFGCGSKAYEHLFRNATDYIGCDTRNSGHDHFDSKVDCYYDGRILPFANQKFDAVVSFEVFEHVFDLSASLKEINRVTKQDGFLLISIPFAWAEHEVPYDFARYTTYGISHLLENHGYQVVEIKKTSSYVLAIFQLLIAYLVQVTPKNMLYYLFQMFLFFPLTLLAYLFDAILPAKNELFLGSVILARKVVSIEC